MGRYLIVDYRADPPFPWLPILGSKLAKIELFTFIHGPGIPKRIAMSQF